MIKVVCPGSFDPLTLGHIDLIKRCASVYDHVYVLIGCNSEKKGLLNGDQRVRYAKDAFFENDNIEVILYPGLIVDFAEENDCSLIVKGVRNSADLEYENNMAYFNSDISFCKFGKRIETVYFPSSPEKIHFSSSAVRQLLSLNQSIDKYVHNSELLFNLLNE